MIRKKFHLCLGRYKYIISVILIAIVLLNYIRQRDLYYSSRRKKCEKILLNEFSDKAKKYINFGKEKLVKTLNATALRRWILRENAHEKILNLELYGPVTTDTLIFVVQVHENSCNINYLLASLSEVEGIEDTLIIFSHSYVDHNLNRLLQSIDFCRTLQIFYPYSVQAYPNQFPGYDKNDCPPNLNIRAVRKLNCTNEITPDVHGRYRNPIYAEKKHHWWWTANKIFANLSHTTEHMGMVIFLEHNFYIYKNFIYIAYKMKSIAETLPQCDILSLGSTVDVKGENLYVLEFTSWNPKNHSNILAIDLSTWNSIKSHYDIFCLTDDYSWSRSLFDISINRRDGKRFKVLSSNAARALPISCSSIGDVMDLDMVEKLMEIIKLQKTDESLFPSYFQIFHNIELYDDDFNGVDYVEINGGWNDERDKQLCRNITINKEKKYFVSKDKILYFETYY